MTKEIAEMINRINEVVNKYRKLQIEGYRRENTTKEDFANLSHDIRTPLTAISGYFELLCDADDKNEKERYVKVIKERISSIEAMLENIFTYSKLQNTGYEMEMQTLDFGQVVINTTLSFYDDIK